MTHKTSVRTLRLANALTQEELANLLGISQTIVSRLESSMAMAPRETVMGLQVIFGVPPCELFASTYEKIESAILRRAASLDAALQDNTDPDSLKKLALLRDMVKRAIAQNPEI